MMEDKDWLKGLRNKMNDYEEPAPEGLWEDIESSVFPRKKHRVMTLPVLWRSVAAAAVVAFGVFAGLRLFESVVENPLDGSQRNLASDQSSSVNSEGSRESSVEIVRKSDPDALMADSRLVRKQLSNVHVMNVEESALGTENTVPESEIEVLPYVSEDSRQGLVSRVEPPARRSEEETSKTEKPEGVDEKSSVVISTDHDGEDWSDYISATSESRPEKRKAAALDVSLSGGSVDSRNESSYDLQMFYKGSSPASTNGLIDDSNNNLWNDTQIHTRGMAPLGLKSGSTVTANSDHKRPVRLALAVNFPVNGTFGLETGATLTTLRSTFTTEAGRTVTETEQTLRYVGIPLNITASLVDSKWVNFYLGGGGMVEKCVSGKSVTTKTLAGIKQGSTDSKSLNVKPLLWSLNASAGLQANLTRRIGLYVEPGLSYHFDDKSDIQTIYNERPLDFMLTFGARFSLK